MVKLTLAVLELTFQSTFRKAVALQDLKSAQVAQACLEAYASYGLQPTDVSLRRGDEIFNYELSFTLFNRSGSFRVSADKLLISFKNAIGPKDLEVIGDCLSKMHNQVLLPEFASTVITANAHASASSEEECETYLKRFADPTKGIISGGVVANVRCAQWPEEIRLMAEKSLSSPKSLFLSWTTIHRGSKLSEESLKVLSDAMNEAASKLDIEFAT